MIALVLAAALAHEPPECAEVARPRPVRDERPVGLFRNTARLALGLWRTAMSPGDGARCTKWPSCSTYALDAVREEGPLLAPFLATHRILSDHGDPDLPVCVHHGRTYVLDPLSESTFWRRDPEATP